MSLAAGIWLLDLTGHAGLAALAALGIYAPSLAAPWLGALVDRFPRRPLLIATEITLGLSALSLLAVEHAGQSWLIYAVMLFRGVGYVLNDAGESALLPAILPKRLLGDVNGWRSSAQEGMKLLAPLAGAGLYAAAGPRPVVLLCAALPLITALLYALLRLHPPRKSVDPGASRCPADNSACPASSSCCAGESAPPGPSCCSAGNSARPASSSCCAGEPARPGPGRCAACETGSGTGPGDAALGEAAGPGGAEGHEVGGDGPVDGDKRVTLGWSSVREGLLVLLREPLRTPVLLAAVAIAGSGLTNAAVLSRLVDGLQLPPTHLGILSSAQGAGSLVAGLVVGRLLARIPVVRVAVIGAVVFAAACLCWALPWWPTMIIGNVLAGVGLVWALIAAVTAVQTDTPDHLLGRVAATANTAMFGPVAFAIPLGAALVGLDDRLTLFIAAASILLTVVLLRRRRPSSRAAAWRI